MHKKLVEFNSFENNFRRNVTSELFEEGDFVEVVGTSKGKGFQGVVKRHGFAGVNDAHMDSIIDKDIRVLLVRPPTPRVFKGMRMAGQTGNLELKLRIFK